MKVLVTGAAGRVGTVVCGELLRHHDLRQMDVQPVSDFDGDVIQGSVADWATVRRAVQGMDAVVHMAIHNPDESRREEHEDYMQNDIAVSVQGTDLLLHASKQAGVKRFVYTSSLNVYSARYPKAGEFLSDSDETLSGEHYGTMKWLAEELCRHYGMQQGLSTIVLRFNTVTFTESWLEQNRDSKHPHASCTRVHVEDVARAVRLAVENQNLPWGRCLVSGANPEKRYDTTTADKLIGFRARYGFEQGRMYRDGEVVDEG